MSPGTLALIALLGLGAAPPAAMAAGSEVALGGRRDAPTPPPAAAQAVDSGRALMRALRCGACHEGVAAPAPSAAPALGTAGGRRNAAWVFAYLAHPTPLRQGIAPQRMPDFHLDAGERVALARFLTGDAAAPGAGGGLLGWLRGLFGGRSGDTGAGGGAGTGGRGSTGGGAGAATAAELTAYAAARRRYPQADSALGRRIFVGLDCAACHEDAGLRAWRSGPPLGGEGARVRPAWLRRWLRQPTPVRPFGFQPGTGSRMPDYHLGADEVRIIAAALEAGGGGAPAAGSAPASGGAGREGPSRSDSADTPVIRDPALAGTSAQAPAHEAAGSLTAFDRAKVEALLHGRLPCLGCHRLDGDGGRIGPDLDAVGARLRPAFLRRMIERPRRTVPGTMMPRVPLTAAEVSLLVRYLDGRVKGPADTLRLSLATTPLRPPALGDSSRQLYLRDCSACHGATGGGDGYNARFLPVPPARHDSARAMSALSNDELFDAIATGGYVMNKSPRMPPFGGSLGRRQILGLVSYIRTLCRCQGPAWSRDGSRQP